MMLSQSETWKFLIAIGSAITVAIPLIQASVAYVAERGDKRFEHYHKLLSIIVRGEDGKPYVHQQIAAIYELRRFKRHFPLTKRILTELRLHWSQSTNSAMQKVIEEIDNTLEFISK